MSGVMPLGIWKQRKRILVVEDSPTMAAIIQSTLKAFNYEVVVAGTGAQALGLIQQESPDLILLDVMLPDTDGIAICQRLKADPSTWEIPVIFVTTRSPDGLPLGYAVYAADGYLAKPIRRWELINSVDNVFRRQLA